jgi:hypothetical protein
MVIRKKGKLRDLGMDFKPSYKCFKNKKIIFIQFKMKKLSLFTNRKKTCQLLFLTIY